MAEQQDQRMKTWVSWMKWLDQWGYINAGFSFLFLGMLVFFLQLGRFWEIGAKRVFVGSSHPGERFAVGDHFAGVVSNYYPVSPNGCDHAGAVFEHWNHCFH